jgi:hypothetical protein
MRGISLAFVHHGAPAGDGAEIRRRAQFMVILRVSAPRATYTAPVGRTGRVPGPRPMLNWLVENFDLLGLSGQNWMWLIGGAVALYAAMLAIARSRHAGLH